MQRSKRGNLCTPFISPATLSYVWLLVMLLGCVAYVSLVKCVWLNLNRLSVISLDTQSTSSSSFAKKLEVTRYNKTETSSKCYVRSSGSRE